MARGRPSCSAPSPITVRLVARMVTPGQRASSSCRSPATCSTCSRLSSTSSQWPSPSCSASASSSELVPPSSAPTARAMPARTSSGRVTPARDEHHPGVEAATHALGHRQGQPGLADPTRPTQGHQPGPLQQAADLGDLVLPAHQRGELHRQVPGSGAHGPGGREVGREPPDHQVVQVLRPGQVPEPIAAQVPQRHPVGQRLGDQPPGGRRDKDLPAVARPGDPGRPMHLQAEVVVPTQDPLPGVQAHPHPQRGRG
jgi:hypothetical protein